jgi:hypothetical protein
MAATAITPFQPPVGVPAQQALAHAIGHIDKFAKKHLKLSRENETLKQDHEERETAWKTKAMSLGVTGLEFLVSGGAGAGLGFVNGKWGGDKDHAAIGGIPVDATTLVAGHIAGLVVGYYAKDGAGQAASRVLHALGNASLGVVTYRLAFQKGAEHAKGASAQANGVKGGTVYTATPAHK